MSRTEELRSLAKDGNVVNIAKMIVDERRSYSITEAEFTKMVHDHAQRDRRTGESPDQAFARTFGANTEEAATLRRAHAIVKNFPAMARTTPIVATGNSAFNVNNDDRAGDLAAMVRREMETAPWLTVEQATARCEAARRAAQRSADGARAR